MNTEELDKALHECMGIIWKAYRESVKAKSFKPFNDCFPELYGKYSDTQVQLFIQGMGMALTPAAHRQIKGESSE